MNTTAITFCVGILVAFIASILKEPSFLAEIEKENRIGGMCSDLTDPEGAKVLIQQQLISHIRKFYKDLNFFKTFFIFLIIALTLTMLAYYLFVQKSNPEQQNDGGIVLVAFVFLVFSSLACLVSIYAYMFSLIIRKYK